MLLHYNLHNLYQIFALIIAKKKFPEKKERKKRQIIQVISGCYSLFASIVIWELFNN